MITLITDLDVLTSDREAGACRCRRRLPATARTAPATYTNVIISILQDKGVYDGDVAYDPNGLGQTLYTGDLVIAGGTTV